MARISPDQRRVAVVVGFPGDIYVYNLETGTGGQRTFDPEADEIHPLWTSDDELLFASRSSDQPGVYSMPAEGGEATFLGIAGGEFGPPCRTPYLRMEISFSPATPYPTHGRTSQSSILTVRPSSVP